MKGLIYLLLILSVCITPIAAGVSNFDATLNITYPHAEEAEFSWVVTDSLYNQSVNFTSINNTGIDFWYWDFGDGNFATGPNATHNYTRVLDVYDPTNETYTTYGDFNVTLIIEKESNHAIYSCTKTITLSEHIITVDHDYIDFNWGVYTIFILIIVSIVILMYIINQMRRVIK